MVSHNIKLLGSRDFTKLLYYVVSQPWETIELVPKFTMVLIYGWDPKMIMYSLWIRSLLMETNSNRYSW